jgi:hypothetical protein
LGPSTIKNIKAHIDCFLWQVEILFFVNVACLWVDKQIQGQGKNAPFFERWLLFRAGGLYCEVFSSFVRVSFLLLLGYQLFVESQKPNTEWNSFIICRIPNNLL